jgi:hypothetical protein
VAKEPVVAYFEIELKPQGSINSDMNLISSFEAKGKDAWTREIITDEAGSLIYKDLLDFFEIDSSDSRKEIKLNNDN